MFDDSKKLNELIRLGTELNTIQDVDILLERILFEARKFVNADAGSIQIKDKDKLVFRHAQTDSLQKELPPGQKLIYHSFRTKINKKSLSGYAATTGEILNIPNAYDIPKNSPYKFDPSNDEKSNFLTVSIMTVPLMNNNKEILGVMQIINGIDQDGNIRPFDEDDEMSVLHFANSASMILERAQMTRALILRMISMAELRDPKETGAHVNRVAAYSVELYEKWAYYKKIPKKKLDTNRDILRMAAMLHDVGKVAISDLILKKPGRFTDEEYEIMKTHSFHGTKLFKNKQSKFDDVAAQVALTHHENWDGTGYPGRINLDTGMPEETDKNGKALPLKGEEIPLWGRIVALADVYDALSSRRVYKCAWEEKDVLNEIRALNGKKFDPELVDIFFESRDIMRAIQARYPDIEDQ